MSMVTGIAGRITPSLKLLALREIAVIVAVWIGLAVVNLVLLLAHLSPGTPPWFPISIFRGPTIHVGGLIYAVAFWLLYRLAVKRVQRISLLAVWGIGLGLVLLGNLAQGGFSTAFLQPLTAQGIQYYNDALSITDWQVWLRQFNEQQASLLTHSQTHPPFAVLVHYFLAFGPDGRVTLAAAFTLISSLSIVLMWATLKTIGLTSERAALLTLLFAVVPAVNIYSAVCLDSVIATCYTVFLFGLVRMIRGRCDTIACVAFAAGLLTSNALTFGGVFLIGVAGLMGLREWWMRKRLVVLTVLAVTSLVGVALGALLSRYAGYDHLSAFVTASLLENPDGPRFLAEPLAYTMTRIEGAAEIALFLSLPALALFFRPDMLGLNRFDTKNDVTCIALSGGACLILMFLAGAYRTGETARTCLFIYPYLLLMLRNVATNRLQAVCNFAAGQTIVMQLLANYVW